MIKSYSTILLLCLFSMASFGHTNRAEPVAYVFDFSDFNGAVKELKISFENVESKKDMIATTTTTLKDGSKINGQFICEWSQDRKSIDCYRDDNGGSFTFVSENNKFKLRFKRFALNEEGSEEDVGVTTRTPGETDEVIGKKE